MSKLIIEMEMKNRCIDCQVRLACKRYIEALQTMNGIEKMRAKIGNDDCLIKGVLPDEHGDLIDRDEMFEAINSRVALIDSCTEGKLSMAVPVVRCKDCKKWGCAIPIEMKEDGYGYCGALCTNTHENEYCAWGERKDDEQ